MREAAEGFAEAGCTDSPLVDARILLGCAAGKSQAWVMAHERDVLDADILERFQTLADQRRAGTPVAYLTGRKAFWSLELAVNESVLIPRPETELVVELALADLGERACRVLDLGTGSGAIALAIASACPACSVVATDRSKAALGVAESNRAKYGLTNVRLIQSDWYEELSDETFDLIVSNPPYVDPAEPHLAGEIRFEPLSALVANDRGLADLVLIIARAEKFLTTSGRLMVEHGFDQGAAVQAMFRRAGFEAIETHSDLAGQPRVTVGVVSGGQIY